MHPGTRLEGRQNHYILHQQLGQPGLFGIAYRAITPADTVVVVKALRSDLPDSDRNRLQIEVDALARMAAVEERAGTQYAVRLLDQSADSSNVQFIVMELATGQNVVRDMLERDAVSSDLALRIAHEFARALQLVHSARLCYDDMKLDNLFWDADRPQPLRIIDWNVVSNLEKSRGVSGDWARFGVCLLQLLTNQYIGINRDAEPDRRPESLSAWKNLPYGLQTIIMRALHLEKDLRYQSDSEILDDLKRERDYRTMATADLLSKAQAGIGGERWDAAHSALDLAERQLYTQASPDDQLQEQQASLRAKIDAALGYAQDNDLTVGRSLLNSGNFSMAIARFQSSFNRTEGRDPRARWWLWLARLGQELGSRAYAEVCTPLETAVEALERNDIDAASAALRPGLAADKPLELTKILFQEVTARAKANTLNNLPLDTPPGKRKEKARAVLEEISKLDRNQYFTDYPDLYAWHAEWSMRLSEFERQEKRYASLRELAQNTCKQANSAAQSGKFAEAQKLYAEAREHHTRLLGFEASSEAMASLRQAMISLDNADQLAGFERRRLEIQNQEQQARSLERAHLWSEAVDCWEQVYQGYSVLLNDENGLPPTWIAELRQSTALASVAVKKADLEACLQQGDAADQLKDKLHHLQHSIASHQLNLNLGNLPERALEATQRRINQGLERLDIGLRKAASWDDLDQQQQEYAGLVQQVDQLASLYPELIGPMREKMWEIQRRIRDFPDLLMRLDLLALHETGDMDDLIQGHRLALSLERRYGWAASLQKYIDTLSRALTEAYSRLFADFKERAQNPAPAQLTPLLKELDGWSRRYPLASPNQRAHPVWQQEPMVQLYTNFQTLRTSLQHTVETLTHHEQNIAAALSKSDIAAARDNVAALPPSSPLSPVWQQLIDATQQLDADHYAQAQSILFEAPMQSAASAGLSADFQRSRELLLKRLVTQRALSAIAETAATSASVRPPDVTPGPAAGNCPSIQSSVRQSQRPSPLLKRRQQQLDVIGMVLILMIVATGVWWMRREPEVPVAATAVAATTMPTVAVAAVASPTMAPAIVPTSTPLQPTPTPARPAMQLSLTQPMTLWLNPEGSFFTPLTLMAMPSAADLVTSSITLSLALGDQELPLRVLSSTTSTLIVELIPLSAALTLTAPQSATLLLDGETQLSLLLGVTRHISNTVASASLPPIRLRSEANSEATRIRLDEELIEVRAGDLVDIEQVADDWCYVRLRSNANPAINTRLDSQPVRGWIERRYVEIAPAVPGSTPTPEPTANSPDSP